MHSPNVATCLSVFVVAALAIPSFAHAECVALWKTARDAQRGSTLVFSGTVIKSAEDLLETTFDVDRVWKGDVRRQTRLTLYHGLESHGVSYFKEGIAYLVFASVMPKLVRTDHGGDTPGRLDPSPSETLTRRDRSRLLLWRPMPSQSRLLASDS